MISILTLADTTTHAHISGAPCPDKACPSCWSSVFWTVLVVGAAYYYVSLNKNRVTNREAPTNDTISQRSPPVKHDKAVTAQPTSVSISTSTVSPTVQNTATNTYSPSELDDESPPKSTIESSESTSPSSSPTKSSPSDSLIELARVKEVVQGLNQLNSEKKRTISELNEKLSSSQALSKEAMSMYEQEAKLRLKSENELKSIILQAQGLLSGSLAEANNNNTSSSDSLSELMEFLREIAAKN